MNKWIAEFELEDGDMMPEHMDLEYKGARIDFHCRSLEQEPFDNRPCISSGVCEYDKQKVLDKIREEIKEWYWQADKQALAKDPCVVDAMIDLFIRTIDKYRAEK